MSWDASISRHPYWLATLAAFVCLSLPAYLLVRGTTDPDRTDAEAQAGMTAAATAYLNAWKAEVPARAERWICGSERVKTEKSWRLPYPGYERIVGYQLGAAEVHHRSGRGSASYSVRVELSYTDGRVQRVVLRMSDERAGWRVCDVATVG